jgi:hypothetical protein
MTIAIPIIIKKVESKNLVGFIIHLASAEARAGTISSFSPTTPIGLLVFFVTFSPN